MVASGASASGKAEPTSGGTAARIATRLTPAAILAVVGIAALPRLVGLPIQPGLTHEEAANGLAVLAALGDATRATSAGYAASEPLFVALQSLLAIPFGLSFLSLRLAAALCGVLTIPALYFAGAQLALWRGSPRRAWPTALISCLLLATSYWHLFFSRLGVAATLPPLLVTLAVGFLWRGLRRGTAIDFALAGLCGGVAAATGWMGAALALALVVGGAACIVGARLGLARVGALVGSAAVVTAALLAATAVAPASRALPGPALDAHWSLSDLIAEVGVTLALDGSLPSVSTISTGAPAFDPLAGLLFWSGLVAAIPRVAGSRLGRAPTAGGSRLAALPEATLLAWVVLALAGSVTATGRIDQASFLAAAPALALLMAVGAGSIVGWAAALRARDVGVIAVTILVAGSALLSGYAYFGRWLAGEVGRSQLLVDRAEAADRIVGLAADHRVFLAPAVYRDPSVRFATREVWSQIEEIGADGRPRLDGRPTAFVFPASERERAALLRTRIGAEAVIDEIADGGAEPLLAVVRLDAASVALAEPPVASFIEQIDLVSASVEPSTVKAGDRVRVYLTWNSRRQIGDDYTMFLHLRDGDNKTIAQVDARPGIDRAPTFEWSPGVRVFDEVDLRVPEGTAPGDLRLVVGLYRAEGLQQLPTHSTTRPVAGAEVTIDRVIVVP